MTVISDVLVTVSPSGSSGPRGNSILSGNGAPDDSAGIEGDYYIDLTNYPASATFYGPRTATDWPADGITLASGTGPSPSTGVTTEEAFGQAASPGVATTYARGDHTHGTPPTSGLVTTAGGGQLAAPLDSSSYTLGQPSPASQAIKVWSCDPSAVASTVATAKGTVYLVAVYPAQNFTTTTMYWHLTAPAVSPIAGQNFVGVYDFSGQLLGSANVDADVITSGTKATALAVPLAAGTPYWAAFVFNSTTTQPTLPRPSSGVTGASSLINVGLSTATLRSATNAVNQTALPSTISPAANVLALTTWAAFK